MTPRDAEPAVEPADGMAGVEVGGAKVPARAGEPAPPGTFDGRARAFREKETDRRSRRRERVGQLLVAAIILLGVYAIVSARPFNPTNGSGQPQPGPPIVVKFTPPVLGQVTCGGGGTAYTEQVVWTNTTRTVTTGDVALRVYELFDGDVLNDRGIVPNVTSSNVCAGTPPNPETFVWYAVVSAPNGTIQLTYAFSPGWASVNSGDSNVPIENGTLFTLVSGFSFAGRGYGLGVTGFVSGSTVTGSVAL
ncbi:MAG TPA: hypothetical protein VMH38_01825 [Thermoplasmata archaeon]|nr:hypothetical protein [Thermoplasmata archaeon]